MKIGELNVGDTVFCTDVRTKTVFTAVLTSIGISYESGYAIGAVFNPQLLKEKTLELAHIHATKEIADKFLEKIKPILEKIDKEIATCQVSVDKQRIEVIGEPAFKDFVEVIKEGRKLEAEKKNG